MSRQGRVLTVIVGAFGVCLLSWTILLAGLLAWSGVTTIEVDTHADGSADEIPSFFIPVPMAIVEMAAWTAPLVFDSEIDRFAAEAELDQVAPAIESLADAVGRMPDGVLLRVEDGGDEIQILQQGGRLRIEVESRDVDVRVGLPSRSVARTLRHLSRLAA